MKKKYILLSAILGVGLGLSSCADQLDADRYFKDRMSLEDVFSSRDYTEEWLANAFEHLTGSNADVSSKGHTMYCFADDMYFGDRDDKYKKWKTVSMMKTGNKVPGDRAMKAYAKLLFLF